MRTATRRSVALLAACLAALAGVLASCSSGSSSSTQDATPTTRPQGSTSTTVAGPKGTVWDAGPEPCALLTDQEIRQLTKFDVDSGPRVAPGSAASPTEKLCLYKNHAIGTEGGQVTLSVIPPDSAWAGTGEGVRSATKAAVTEGREVPGLGEWAYVGHLKQSPATGPTVIVVDMGAGRGGFGIAYFAYQEISEADLVNLASLVASRWPAQG